MSAGHSEYPDGKRIEVGDSVLIEHGRTPGTVELLVRTDAEMAAIGVSEPGIMLLSPPFGRVYLPARSLIEDPLEFVSRATGTQPGIDFPRGSAAIAMRELVGERNDIEKRLPAKSAIRARGNAWLDLDGDRRWRRTVDAHSRGTMALDQWLVRFSFGALCLPRHRLGPAALRWSEARLDLARRGRRLLYSRPHRLVDRPWLERIMGS
jgi:hypothetical protein